MASKKWMLGHSEDYVSVFVSWFGAHCNSLSFVIISQPNHTNEASSENNIFCKMFTALYVRMENIYQNIFSVQISRKVQILHIVTLYA